MFNILSSLIDVNLSRVFYSYYIVSFCFFATTGQVDRKWLIITVMSVDMKGIDWMIADGFLNGI